VRSVGGGGGGGGGIVGLYLVIVVGVVVGLLWSLVGWSWIFVIWIHFQNFVSDWNLR